MKELRVLFALREMVITIYSSPTEYEAYLIANELLNRLERMILEDMEEELC